MEELKNQLEELRKLREFKAYVHSRLDSIGIPSDPEPEKNAEHGCRIEGRLNELERRVAAKLAHDPLRLVSQFHNMFGHPVLDTPQIPDKKRSDLRRALIREEFKEFEEAVEAGDLVAVADALCDILYVLSGTILEFGLKEKFPLMFAEVQRSNMSKACATQEEAEETIRKYQEEKEDQIKRLHLVETIPAMHWEEKDGKFLVYRTSDRKTLKSINYSPANLQQFL